MILERSYIESVVREIADRYEVKQIELVGDYRRAKAKETSTIDLMIIDNSAPIGLDFYSMICDLEDTLEKEVNLVTAKGLKMTQLGQKAYDRLTKGVDLDL